MDFKFNEDQQLLQTMFSEFVEAAVEPVAAELDEKEMFPEELIPQMGEIGMMGITVPEDLGGVGLGMVETTLAVEEIAKACASTAIAVGIHNTLACWPIQKFGTDAQKEAYLADMASGEKLGAFALTEPNVGSDAAGVATTAVEQDDCYVLNGSKSFITNGERASVYIVIAATDKAAGKKGLSAFIVEKGMPGFNFDGHEKKMGIRGSATHGLTFEDVKVPKENLLGKPGEGLKIALTAIDGVRIAIAAQACGIAQHAIDLATKQVQERTQFGQTIASFQNTQFTLADMQTRVDAARLLTYRAAAQMDAGEDYASAAAMAKLFASETASYVTGKAVQLYGGYGYSREYPVERLMRDAKITELYGGTSEVQKIVISRKMGLN